MDDKDTFRAGICMAGAVSAGAYTAGVMDYLIEALERWDKAKKLGIPGVPSHKFVIEVLGGASAGGMTAAITAAGIQENFIPVTQNNVEDSTITSSNPFFNSWVNLKETNDKDMMDLLLDTDDIIGNPDNSKSEVRSGFNSKFIESVASELLGKKINNPYSRSYFAEDLEVFTTLTNLRGMLYEVKFKTASGDRTHHMRMHRDYAFFRMDKTSNGLANGRIPIYFDDKGGINIDILKKAAMGTGAFPIGLESRDLTRKKGYIESNKYLNLKLSRMHHATGTTVSTGIATAIVTDVTDGANDVITTAKDTISVTTATENSAGATTIITTNTIEYTLIHEEDFLSLNVDGGVINNEPYEITEQLLIDRNNPDNPGTIERSGAKFDTTVIMIDPFPDTPENLEQYIPKKAWKHVVPKLILSMRNQLMMKDEIIKRAYFPDDYTRFLIMPERYAKAVKDGEIIEEKQKNPIACGALGGFSGFFSKAFRRHDYFLGRRNCQRFLQYYFNVPEVAGNPILKNGYSSATYGKVVLNDQQTDVNGNVTTTKKTYLSLIPDIAIVQNGDSYSMAPPPEEKIYPFPTIKLSYILGLNDKIKNRVKCVIDNIDNNEHKEAEEKAKKEQQQSLILEKLKEKSTIKKISSWLFSKLTDGYLSIGKRGAKNIAAGIIVNYVIEDLEKHKLIDDDIYHTQ